MGDDYNKVQFCPEILLDKIFSQVELSDLLSCMLVCKNWYRVLKCEKAKPWKEMCRKIIPKEGLDSEIYSKLDSPKAIVRTYCHGWNPTDCSEYIHIRPNGISLMYDCAFIYGYNRVRSKVGYLNGVHVWEFTYKPPFGFMETVGVLLSTGGVQGRLVGNNILSCGWEMLTSFLYENNETIPVHYPSDERFDIRTELKIRMVLDCDRGELRYESKNRCLGVAFKNLPKIKLYPLITFSGISFEKTIEYIGNRSNNS